MAYVRARQDDGKTWLGGVSVGACPRSILCETVAQPGVVITPKG